MTDYLIHVASYPKSTLRFSRLLRSFFLISFSKNLRRNIKGVIGSLKNLLLLFLLYFLIILLWAFIGINLIGDLKDIVPYDTLSNNYGNLLNLSYMLYLLSFMDYYPDM